MLRGGGIFPRLSFFRIFLRTIFVYDFPLIAFNPQVCGVNFLLINELIKIFFIKNIIRLL